MSSGISAVIGIVCVAWLGSSFFEGNQAKDRGAHGHGRPGADRLFEDAERMPRNVSSSITGGIQIRPRTPRHR